MWQDTRTKFEARCKFECVASNPVSSKLSLVVWKIRTSAAYITMWATAALDPAVEFHFPEPVLVDGVTVMGRWDGTSRGLPAVTALCKRNGYEWQTPVTGDKMIAPDSWTFCSNDSGPAPRYDDVFFEGVEWLNSL